MNQLPLIPIRTEDANNTNCRIRRQPADRHSFVYKKVATTPTDSFPVALSTPRTSFNSLAPGVFFLTAMTCYVASGVFSLASPPQASSAFGEHNVPSDASCLRASRHADYTSIEYSMGTPTHTISLLLRLDMITERSPTASNARIFSNRVAESKTVRCDGNLCSDIGLVQRGGPSSASEEALVRFQYTNPQNEANTFSTASSLGLSGELSLHRGYEYYLSATHFCWVLSNSSSATDAASKVDKAVTASTKGGFLHSNASQLIVSKTSSSSPVATAHQQGHCNFSTVAFFPGAASDESTWLGLGSTRRYEDSPEGVDERRMTVEVGTNCASMVPNLANAYSLYQLDCLSVYTPCTTLPTLPFRRFASDEIRLHISGDGSERAFLWSVPDPRLRGLPRLEDQSASFWLSIVKLAVMTLTAAITWIRAAKATSSHHQLFMFCVRSAHCQTERESINRSTVNEDCLIGLLAIVARAAVALWRTETLYYDGHLRVTIFQLIAASISLLQWFTRYYVLQWRCESPLTKLGGSTALCDATSAVMLAFAEPPLMVSSIGRFDPTARLLTALLLTIVTMQRCAFAASCCGLLWVVVSNDLRNARSTNSDRHFSEAYAPILLFAALCWLIQAAAVGNLLADLFAVPLAHSAARGSAGEWIPQAFACFFGITVAALPQLMKTVERIASDDAKCDRAK